MVVLGVVFVLACSSSSSGGCAARAPSGQVDERPAREQPVTAPGESDAETPAKFVPPTPPAMAERVQERHRLVRDSIQSSRGGRTPVRDPDVLRAMRDTPRHAFVPASMQSHAYHDRPLSIGRGQTISQPYIVAYMTEMLDIDENSRVLEIGTGSGYQAAVLAHLTPHVWSIEIVEALAERAKRDLMSQGYDNIRLRTGDGYAGWPEEAPFDAIIITAAAAELPEPLWEQLAPGGRIVMPRGPQGAVQDLIVIHKDEDGAQRTERHFPVRFVPFTRSE